VLVEWEEERPVDDGGDGIVLVLERGAVKGNMTMTLNIHIGGHRPKVPCCRPRRLIRWLVTDGLFGLGRATINRRRPTTKTIIESVQVHRHHAHASHCQLKLLQHGAYFSRPSTPLAGMRVHKCVRKKVRPR
jgi:hypothetical protein